MAQTTSLVFNGGVIPSPAPTPSCTGKAKLLKIGEITITEQGVQVTKNVICDPDSVTTVAPFMEVLTSARLAELVQENSVLVLDNGTMQYLMASANIVVEDETPVCTSVSFLGLSREHRAKVTYSCTHITDELTLQQVIEVGEPVETNFDLVAADSEDTESGALIDKLEIVDNVREPEDPTDVPILGLEVTTDSQGNRKVAINEDNLRTFADNVSNEIYDIIDTLDSMDFDEVPHGSFGSSLNQSPGDGTSTSIQISVFRPLETTVGEAITWTKTTEIGGEDFGTVTLEPGTYIICSDITCQWVGAPAGTYLPQVGNVLGEPFDFSQQQEVHRRMTNAVTVSTATQFKMRINFDAATPVMGFWINSTQIVKIAGGMSQTNVAHDSTLTGQGSVADPLGVTPAAFGEIKNIPTSISQFRTGDVIPVDGPSGPAKMPASDLQDTILGGPIDEAVQAWLDEHPEATTTVEDNSLTEAKFSDTLKLQTIKDYVTPEMFGAVGDGATDDTNAFNDMIAAGAFFKLPPGKTYLVQPITVNKRIIIDGSGSTIKALSQSQEFVLKLTQSYCILRDLVINGSATIDSSGSVIAVSGNAYGLWLAGSSDHSHLYLNNVRVQYCKTGIYSDKFLWATLFSMVQVYWCTLGVDLAYNVLNVKFDTLDMMHCAKGIHFAGGSSVAFSNSTFGSSKFGVWLENTDIMKDCTFRNCDFEESYIHSNEAAIVITVDGNFYFDNCLFSRVTNLDTDDPSSTAAIIKTNTSSEVQTTIKFSKCYFTNNANVPYFLNYNTGDTTIVIVFDYYTFKKVINVKDSSDPRIRYTGVYAGNAIRFEISDIPVLRELPPVSYFGTYKSFFAGTCVRITKTGYLYIFDSVSWVRFPAESAVEKVFNTQISVTDWFDDVPDLSEKSFWFKYDSDLQLITDKPQGVTTAAVVKIKKCYQNVYIFWYSGIFDGGKIFVAMVGKTATSIPAWNEINTTQQTP